MLSAIHIHAKKNFLNEKRRKNIFLQIMKVKLVFEISTIKKHTFCK